MSHDLDKQVRFEAAADRWKSRTSAVYRRLIVLDRKGEDSGLTEEERHERDRLKLETIDELLRFLKDIWSFPQGEESP